MYSQVSRWTQSMNATRWISFYLIATFNMVQLMEDEDKYHINN